MAGGLPWFRFIENDSDFGGRPYHGDHGPITISRYPREGWYPLFERFAESALARGHGWVDDHNAPGAVGVGPVPLNMVDGRRQTQVDHYLDPVLDDRPNLTLIPDVLVDRVVLEGGRPRAVVASTGGREERYGADLVLLALGSYATPAALLRSGIGPPEELARHEIPVVHELPAVAS